jgi:polysaccharide export outer membrane protein
MNHKPQIILFCATFMILLMVPSAGDPGRVAQNVLTDIMVNNDPQSGWVSFEFDSSTVKPPIRRVEQKFPDRLIITLPDTRIGGDLRDGLFYEKLFCADSRDIVKLIVNQIDDPPSVRLTLFLNQPLNSYVEDFGEKIATLHLTSETVPLEDVPLRLVANADSTTMPAEDIDELIRKKVHEDLPAIGGDIDQQMKTVEEIMTLGKQNPDFQQMQSEPSTKYRIQAGDKLIITVLSEPDFTATVAVRPDGYITYTLLGDVVAEGLTPTELAMILKNRLMPMYFNYEITLTVSVIDYTPTNIYLIGNIPAAGPVIYRKGMTILDVMSNFDREKVDITDVSIIRKGIGKIPVNLDAVLKGDIDQNIELLPHDYVLFPSKDLIRVMVFGKVRQPGMFKVQNDSRVYDAIASAGGYTDRCNIKSIFILRENGENTERLQVDLRKFHEVLDTSQNVLLQDRDIIFVPETSRTDWQKVLDTLQQSSMTFYDWRRTLDF